MTNEKIAVLYGGTSAEREVSLQSGAAVLQALLEQGFNAVGIDAEGEQLKAELINQKIDRCVIMFHGLYGEGGKVQKLLDELKVPYTGSDAKSSRTGMHKLKCKGIWHDAGILTSQAHRMENSDDIRKLRYPVAIKPEADGSSIGVHKVNTRKEVKAAYEDAKQYGNVMVEEWISGKELTVSIVDGKALPIIWINSPDGFYDYKAKYISDSTEYVFPTDIPEKIVTKIQQTALKAFELIGCHGWGRVDFILDDEDYYILEINTVPGMTSHSLVPKAAKQIGWSFNQLVSKILETSKR
jgi:D-alanine-D-alanine ligase